MSAFLLIIIFSFLPIKDVGSAMRAVPVTLWTGLLAVFLLVHCLAAAKWWLLTAQFQIPYSEFLKAHFVGLMSNLCLPSVAGGDVVRAAWVLRQGKAKARIGVASVTDRLLDILALLILALAGAVFVSSPELSVQSVLLTVGIILSVSFGAIVVGIAVLLRWRPGGKRLHSITEAIEAFVQRPGLLLRSLLLSLLVQSIFVGLNIVLGMACGVEVSVAVWFLAWPLAKLVAIVPITLGGLGVRESTLILLVKPFGADGASIAACGLLWQAVLIVGGLVGGLVALHSNRSTQLKHVNLS